ncbi:MAG: PadR family transcriptional regulator [Nitrosarchaeum sp.]|nr:PadR family transcriptional regulator [Nitrosarchaeum sp.]
MHRHRCIGTDSTAMTSAILRDKLKTLILRELHKEPQSGYSLIKNISTATGWKPSYGSMYPMLEHLSDEGLVNHHDEGRKKIYALTPLGKEALHNLKAQQAQMAQKMQDTMKLMCHMMGLDNKTHDDLMSLFISAMERGETPFKEVTKATTDIKKAFWDLYRRDLVKKNQKKINSILQEATRKLRMLK